MTDQKIKTAAGKPPLNLVPQASLIGPARVAQHGAAKYARGNWHTADDVTGIADRYAGAVLRHLGSMQNANGTYDMGSIGKLDLESGLPEIDHAIMGLLMLRGLAIKHEFMPADPGLSLLLRAASADAPSEHTRPTVDMRQLELDFAPPVAVEATPGVFVKAPRPPTPRVPKIGDRVTFKTSSGIVVEGPPDARHRLDCYVLLDHQNVPIPVGYHEIAGGKS